jgi:hypothetical protein
MLDMRAAGPSVWPQHLQPVDDDSARKETFASWWERNLAEIGHLHPLLAEQWIYRHWRHTDFAFLPLDSLEWDLVEMSGEEFLENVRREISKRLDPEFDYEQFQGRHGWGKTATARDLDSGTWTYPIVALSTPSGWTTQSDKHPHDPVELPDERLMLLEGHQRHRYLNALHHRGTPPPGPHRVFVVRSPVVT